MSPPGSGNPLGWFVAEPSNDMAALHSITTVLCVIVGSYFWRIPKTSGRGSLSQNPPDGARSSCEGDLNEAEAADATRGRPLRSW
jgi:hypothetical protein